MFNPTAFGYAAFACLLIAFLYASIADAIDHKGWKRVAGITGVMLAFSLFMAFSIPSTQPDQRAEQGGQEVGNG